MCLERTADVVRLAQDLTAVAALAPPLGWEVTRRALDRAVQCFSGAPSDARERARAEFDALRKALPPITPTLFAEALDHAFEARDAATSVLSASFDAAGLASWRAGPGLLRDLEDALSRVSAAKKPFEPVFPEALDEDPSTTRGALVLERALILARLEAVAGLFLLVVVPQAASPSGVDPFTGGPLHVLRGPEGRPDAVYSAGRNRQDEGGAGDDLAAALAHVR